MCAAANASDLFCMGHSANIDSFFYAILTFRFKYEILYSIDFKAFYSSQRAFENNLKLIINMAFFEHPLLPAMRDIINTTQCQGNF